MDKITAINVFLNVAETGSFTLTAEQLGLSKPMVSRHIALIEEWLGARLLQRTTRQVSLTDVGEQAVVFCQKIANTVLEMEQEIASKQGELRGNIRLTSNTLFGSTHLLSAVSDFLHDHPRLNIQLHLTDLIVDLISERIDLAVRFTNAPDPNLVARKLSKVHSILVATPEYLAKNGIPQSPEALHQHYFLAHTNVNRKAILLRRQEEEVMLELGGQLSSNDISVLFNSTLAHQGIAMLPKYLVADALKERKLKEVLDDWHLPTFYLYILYPSRHRLPLAVRKLIDFLAERFQGMDW